MLIIKSIETIEVPNDVHPIHYCTLDMSNYVYPVDGSAPIEKTVWQEMVVGKKFYFHDGRKLVVGMSMNAQEELGLFVSAWDKAITESNYLRITVRGQDELIEAQRFSIKKRDFTIANFSKMNIWQRIKFLFTKKY